MKILEYREKQRITFSLIHPPKNNTVILEYLISFLLISYSFFKM